VALLGLAAVPFVHPAYHALSANRAPAVGNIVVIFTPDTRERDLTEALQAARARVVDGPTASHAFVISVASADRSAALASLKARRDIVLAEPVETDVSAR